MSNKKIYLAVLLAIGVSTTFTSTIAATVKPASDAPWQHYVHEAVVATSEQKFGEAEQHLRKALALIPADKAHDEERSKLLLKLANTLTLNNQTADAQGYYQKLLTLEEHHHGADSAHIVPALLALGSIQESEGDHTTAMRYYRRAMQINEQNYGPYSPAVADSLHRMGRAGWKAGNRSESSSNYKRSISILLQQPGLGSGDDLLKVMNDYSDKMKGGDNSNKDLLSDFKQDILSNKISEPETSSSPTNSKKKKNSFNTAEIISRNSNSPASIGAAALETKGTSVTASSAPQNNNSDAGSSLTRIQPEDIAASSTAPSSLTPSTVSPSAASSTVSPPIASFSQQDRIRLNAMKDQQTNMDPSVTLRGMQRPMESATLSPAYSILNSSLSRQSRYGQSADNLERTIAADINALGPNHPTVANDLTALAQVKIADGKYQEARGLLYKALPIYEKVYGVNNALTINALASLAFTENQCGNVDVAFTLYRKALMSAQTVLGPNNLETARILNEMAHMYYAQGKLQEARTFYEWAVASTEAAVGDHDSLLAACLKDYAQVLKTMGKDSEASVVELRAQKISASAT